MLTSLSVFEVICGAGQLAVGTVLKYGGLLMKAFTAVVERDPEAGLYVGYVSGLHGKISKASVLELGEELERYGITEMKWRKGRDI